MGLWNQVAKLGERETWCVSTELWEVLTDLSKSRNYWAMTWLLEEHRALVMKIKDPKSQKNLLHLFVEYRWPYSFLQCRHPEEKLLLREVDYQESEAKSSLSIINDGKQERKKPIEVFCDEHKNLSEEIKGAAKRIVKSGMLVAALVATLAFAAAFTVSDDKDQCLVHYFLLNKCSRIIRFLCIHTLFLVKFHYFKICTK